MKRTGWWLPRRETLLRHCAPSPSVLSHPQLFFLTCQMFLSLPCGLSSHILFPTLSLYLLPTTHPSSSSLLVTPIQPVCAAAGGLEAAQRSRVAQMVNAVACHPLLPSSSLPSPPTPTGHMSSRCLLGIKPNYSVGFPQQPHPDPH